MRTMTIGKAARLSGVGVETVRFYERRGLIDQPPRPANGGFRVYPEPTVERIRFIRQAQELGFSLAEIAGLLALRADPSADCAEVRDHAEAKLDEVERKIAGLEHLRQALAQIIAACPGQGALGACTIMDALAGAGMDALAGAGPTTAVGKQRNERRP
jgi:MerR family mercuric resistance operon transcriptional regulator